MSEFCTPQFITPIVEPLPRTQEVDVVHDISPPQVEEGHTAYAVLTSPSGLVYLLRSAKRSSRGSFVLPGGLIETNDDVEDALIGVVRDYTGLRIRLTSEPRVFEEVVNADRNRQVEVLQKRYVATGEMRGGREGLDTRKFKQSNWANLQRAYNRQSLARTAQKALQAVGLVS